VAKWVKVGGVLLALAWAPFLYAELANEGPEQRERALPDVTHDDNTALQPATDPEHAGLAGRPATAPAAVPGAVSAGPAEEAHPAEPPAAEAAPAAVAAVAPQPAPAQPTAEQVEQLAAVLPVQPEGNAPIPEGSEELVAEGEEEEPEPTPPTSSGPAEALKQAYEQQPRDPLWAADVEGKLSALFGNAEVPAELLRSASCRKAVCRVELRWTSAHATAYVSAYEAIQKQIGGEIGVEPVGAPSEKGEQQVNLYLTRKGYTLADLSR
jgi:hypothetical protein